MNDREKVLKGLECCTTDMDMNYEVSCDSEDCPYTGEDGCIIKLCSDALALLKEESKIVRCKDCKHRPTDPENKGIGQTLVFPDDICPCQIGDNWYSWMPKDNEFCAYGERKDDDA